MGKKEKFIVCCALPYANGPLHIGHLAGCYVPGDIYVRFKRLQGHDVHFLCGTDEHGAAITILAQKQKISPQEVVDKYHQILKADMLAAGIQFDVFSRTTKPFHYKRSQEFFLNCLKNGYIEKKNEQRLHCSNCKQFLPDRYVVGECPVCHAPGARGDQCEKCGAWFEPEELINPICQICGVTHAGLQPTTHWYLLLDKLGPKLKEYLDSKSYWRKNVLGYAYQPLKAELQPRSITRDLNWGIEVPLEEAKGKVLYVWFDAPIGYISASEDWGIQLGEPEKWRSYWEDPEAKLVHFIGKDNIIFHTVVWPAVLMGDGRYPLPYLVAGNEFLNLEGQKISTSRNFAIWASEATALVGSDALRFYLTRISPETSDSNFLWNDFQLKVNGELADVIGNLVNRSLSFLLKEFEGKIAAGEYPGLAVIRAKLEAAFKNYSEALEGGFTKIASDHLVDFARSLNVFFQEQAPWKQKKSDPALAHQTLSATVFGVKALALMLFPICPGIADKIWLQLGMPNGVASYSFEHISTQLPAGHTVSPAIGPVVTKVEDSLIAQEREKLNQVISSIK